MAIEWGSWQYGGGNGMRVGLDVSVTAVGHNSGSVKFTVRVYTENQYYYNDSQSLSYGGNIGGSHGYDNNQGGSAVLRDTLTHTYSYGTNSYGDSPGTRTFSASLTGAYNGVSPSKSVTVKIPARPIASPTAPASASAAYVSDASANVTWSNRDKPAEPYVYVFIEQWNSASNSWSPETRLPQLTEKFVATGLSANRSYRWRVRARNPEGYSAYTYTDHLQTRPAAPSGARVAKAGVDAVTVSWANGAPSANYTYSTQVERSVNGGAWTQVSTPAEGVTSGAFSGLTPGAVYQFRVRHVSHVGTTTTSAYSTTETIQLQAPPAAPTGLTAVRDHDGSMTLNWKVSPTVDSPVDIVTVQRWDNVENQWTTVGNLPGDSVTFTDTSTLVNRKYQYQIRTQNSAGVSPWVASGFLFTTPDAPDSVNALYTGGTEISVSWVSRASYLERTVKVLPYKNGVAQAVVTLGAGTAEYVHADADILATYHFDVWTVSKTGALASAAATSNSVMGAAPPSAPGSLAPSGGVVDFSRDVTLTWLHTASQDGSSQRRYELQYRVDGGAWVSTGVIVSGVSSHTIKAGTIPNGKPVEWQVRTHGVHSSPGPWSSIATLTGSTTPTIALNSPGATIPMSAIEVAWNYFDPEGTPQAEWGVTLLDETNTVTLEQMDGADATNVLTLNTVATNGESYVLRLRVRDGSGLWSDVVTQHFTAKFIPPAPSELNADLDEDSGSVVLTLNPTVADGVTTLPATTVDIERQIFDPETEAFGDWEPVAFGLAPDATVIDTTAPIHGDGHYRVITHSAAPSSFKPTKYVAPWGTDDKWCYVNAGPQFDQVCRLWANVEIGWKASRSKALHYFAGRKRPVLYSGESSEKVLTVSGLLTSDASAPHAWMRLAQQPGAVLFRGPNNMRVYGALSEVSVERIHGGLHRISFSIQEVYR